MSTTNPLSTVTTFCGRCGGFVSGMFAGQPNRCTCRVAGPYERIASIEAELAQWKAVAERLAKEMVTFAADFHGRYGYEHCTAKEVRAEFDRLKSQSK